MKNIYDLAPEITGRGQWIELKEHEQKAVTELLNKSSSLDDLFQLLGSDIPFVTAAAFRYFLLHDVQIDVIDILKQTPKHLFSELNLRLLEINTQLRTLDMNSLTSSNIDTLVLPSSLNSLVPLKHPSAADINIGLLRFNGTKEQFYNIRYIGELLRYCDKVDFTK